MTLGARRWVLAGAGLAVVIIVGLAVFVLLPDDPAPSPAAGQRDEPSSSAPPRATQLEVADDFLAAFAGGDAAAAAALTDDAAAAAKLLAAVRTELAPTSVKASRTGAQGDAVTFAITWTLGPQRVWTYDSTMTVARAGEDWRVHWDPALVHQKLTAERGLTMLGQLGQPAVLDRDGAPLLIWQAGGPAAPIPAQGAVNSVGRPARLVAIRPSTGDILAVAQNGPAGTDPWALNGLYAPGSTFKIATATAALMAGAASPDTVLPCPGSITIGTRTIPNDDGFALGDVPMHTAFARSCNTTFGKLAADLEPDALSEAAGRLGLGADFVVPGITTEAGAVAPAPSSAQRVENGIGQGTVRLSPFGVALMSATVASGRAVVPRLWRDLATTVTLGYQPPPRAVLDAVRAMMREVVTAGTGRGLAGRGAVFGKTGTAQFGDGSAAHGWFTGYRGDLAWAVLVEGAGSSGPAVAASSAFLGALG